VLIDQVSPWLFKIKKADMGCCQPWDRNSHKWGKLLQRYVIEPKASQITGAAAIAILARNASAINFVSGWVLMFSSVSLSVSGFFERQIKWFLLWCQ